MFNVKVFLQNLENQGSISSIFSLKRQKSNFGVIKGKSRKRANVFANSDFTQIFKTRSVTNKIYCLLSSTG